MKILVTKIHVWDSKQNDGRERKGLNLLWIIKSCSTFGTITNESSTIISGIFLAII